jgi:hypothetical protein
MCWTARWLAGACSAIAIRSSSASSTPSRSPSRPARPCTSSSTTTRPISIQRVIAWLVRHPRVTFHFTPTSASWLNAVEGFFAALTKCRLRRGTFLGVVDLQAAINRYLADHNVTSGGRPRPSMNRCSRSGSLSINPVAMRSSTSAGAGPHRRPEGHELPACSRGLILSRPSKIGLSRKAA